MIGRQTTVAVPKGLLWRAGLYFLILAGLLLTPFLLRPTPSSRGVSASAHLVVMTPHDQSVRFEVAEAFKAHWLKKTGELVEIDWRIPGGASEIMLYLRSEFAARYRDFVEQGAPSGGSGSADPQAPPTSEVFQQFIQSGAGIGVDVLFGGGAADFQQLAEAGYFDAGAEGTAFGLKAIRRDHPAWFEPSVIPEFYRGERYRDQADRWVGVVLASFGILYNRDLFLARGIPTPLRWEALASPDLLGSLALADPTKSGSVAKAFELMIQQHMSEALADLKQRGVPNPEPEALAIGWRSGLALIQRMAANARYFSDSAGKIGLEVARGDAAAGMAIDVYGRIIRASVARPGGDSRLDFVLPKSGTSLSVDPVGMLVGAPHPELATAFMTFLLSPEGQRLWNLRPGAPGGPLREALRRFPIRADLYPPSSSGDRDPAENPYQEVGGLLYHPSWTQGLFSALRFVIRVSCVEPHQELQAAWEAIIQSGMNPRALAEMQQLSSVDLDQVRQQVVPVLKSRDKVREMTLSREMGAQFRAQYRRAAALAANGAQP